MKKIISLCITLFCLFHIVQSCDEANPFKSHKPGIVAAIYEEQISLACGTVISEGSKVCLDPKAAEKLPLRFNIESSDGSTRRLTWWGVGYENGTYQDFVVPKHPESSSVLFFNCDKTHITKRTYSLLSIDPSLAKKMRTEIQKGPFDFFTYKDATPLVFSRAHIPFTTPRKTNLA